MKLATASESMQAVTSSGLGKELESIWQEVIDFREKTCKGMSFQNKVKAIQTFFAKTTGKRFMDAVWKHTGLWIETVFFKPHFETSFCTWIAFGKTDETLFEGTKQIEGILDGSANSLVNDWFSSKEFSVDELIMLAKSYDLEKGIIKPDMRAKIKKLVRCAMGFDLSLGFLSKDYLPENAGLEYLTARELTGIMLHEIGHNLTLVEHAADMYAHVSAFKALRNAFSKNATPEKAIELGKKVAGFASKAGMTEDAASLLNATMQAEKDLKSAGKHPDVKGCKTFIGSLIISSFALLDSAIVGAIDVLIADPSRADLRTRAGQNKKLGDVLINTRMTTWQERKADEYAFSHGYGADCVEGLEKITRFYNLIGRSAEDIQASLEAEREHKALGLCTKLQLTAMAQHLMAIRQFRLYPPGADRYREIMRSTIRELKNHGASAEYVTKYMEDIERILKIIENRSREDKYFDDAYNSYKVFLKYCSIRSFVSWFVHGRCDTELVETLDNIQKLSNSLLTFYGEKFTQLAKKGK